MGLRGRFDPDNLTEFEIGFFVGVLVGDGSFTGTGKVAQITVRMLADHSPVFMWLGARFGGRVYGPYEQEGKIIYQWMAAGRDAEQLVPILDEYLRPEHSHRAYRRYWDMKERYGLIPPAVPRRP